MADNNMPEKKEVRESKNFIENIIEKDIADGVYDRPIKTRSLRSLTVIFI